jgi:hypothetical protein
MAEKPLYLEDIISITLKELNNGKSKVVIKSKKKKMNFQEIDPEMYFKLVKFSKLNLITFYLENRYERREKVN